MYAIWYMLHSMYCTIDAENKCYTIYHILSTNAIYGIFSLLHTRNTLLLSLLQHPCPHVTQTCWTRGMVAESRVEGSYAPVAIVYETSARQSAAISDLQNHFFRAAFVVFGLHSVLKTLKPIQLHDSWRNCCLVTIFVSCLNHLEYSGRDDILKLDPSGCSSMISISMSVSETVTTKLLSDASDMRHGWCCPWLWWHGNLQHLWPGGLPAKEVSQLSNFSLVLLLMVGLHHLYSELCAYDSLTSLLSQPEMVIMRHFGVVRRRKYLVTVGICEAFLLFTDVTFPFVARECDDILTENWKTAWRDVPMIGDVAVQMVETLRFWGFAVLSSATGILVNGAAWLRVPKAAVQK